MTHWHGRMGRGARRQVRELKREEAAARDVDFEARIARIMAEQNVSRITAYPIAANYGRMAQAKRRAGADRMAGYTAYLLAEPTPPRASRAWRQGWERALTDERGETTP